MPAAILDGKQFGQTMRAETGAAVAEFVARHGVRPGLAAVLVGDNPASKIYVRNKRKACEQAGIASWLHELPAETDQSRLLKLIDRLNPDKAVHGILVQLSYGIPTVYCVVAIVTMLLPSVSRAFAGREAPAVGTEDYGDPPNV